MTATNYRELEQKIDRLIALCAKLHDENRAIRRHAAAIQSDHDALVGRIAATGKRLESLIARLAVLERNL